MVIKQNLRNHLFVFRFTIETTVILILGWKYFDIDNDYFKVAALFIMPFILPALFLHFEYAIRNAGELIEINSEKITVKKNNEKKEYNRTDITQIIVYKSASLDRWGIPFSQMEYYHFARLIASSGEEIIITCLMCQDVNKVVSVLNGVPYVRKKSFFCTTFWK